MFLKSNIVYVHLKVYGNSHILSELDGCVDGDILTISVRTCNAAELCISESITVLVILVIQNVHF